tara:strand:+ start:17181 stop:17609 length:429 start_codon:yes stop_codon:yes gene_type:complete
MKVAQSVALNATADQVWNYVRDFYNFPEWQPHIASAERGPNPGERKVLMKRGNTVLDRIHTLDDTNMVLAYEMVPGQDMPPGAPRLEGFLATFKVTADGDKSNVSYSIEVEVPEAIREMAEKGMGSDISGALDGLKAKFGAV